MNLPIRKRTLSQIHEKIQLNNAMPFFCYRHALIYTFVHCFIVFVAIPFLSKFCLYCCRVICADCIDELQGAAELAQIEATELWMCYTCRPDTAPVNGLLKPKLDWKQNLLILFQPEGLYMVMIAIITIL